MTNNIDYKLESATKNDTELLIKYKLASILEYVKSPEEREKLTNYVQNTIPSKIKDYQIIVINNQKVGCLLL